MTLTWIESRKLPERFRVIWLATKNSIERKNAAHQLSLDQLIKKVENRQSNGPVPLRQQELTILDLQESKSLPSKGLQESKRVIIQICQIHGHVLYQILASVPYDWSRTQLIVFAWMRTLLIPLLLLCATPRGHPLIPREGYPMLFSLLLGVTNGLVGSVPMILAPSRVPEEHRELTGITNNNQTLFLK
uniref:Uncharacterized protein n=1 Tax=Timema monikensis TaxID=170555 RepID=A0A7R9E8P8_9NEOP|nr:unnamed protein product [Timema monikensis]